MKMKNYRIGCLVILVVVVVGCGGVYKASVKPTADGVQFESLSAGITPPPSAGQLGSLMIDASIAYKIRKDADQPESILAQNAETTVNMAVIRMINRSSYAFEVTTGDFKSLVLAPGESSPYVRYIPYGAYKFRVRFKSDSGGITEWTLAEMITRRSKEIVLKNKY
jgi:hypothetical protein